DLMLRMLRTEDIAAMAEQALELCAQHDVAESYGLAIGLRPAISAAAAPFSRTGISARSRVLMRSVGGQIARIADEATVMVKGSSARTRKEKDERRREQNRREDERLAVAPEEHYEAAVPPPSPVPLDVGESLDARIAQQQEERQG